MKKIFILLISAVLVFSISLVSMGAPTIKGDLRYNMYDDESKDEDQSYATTDLRISIEDEISDSLNAFVRFRAQHKENDDETKTDVHEYWTNYKRSWGSIKTGYYEYKFTPSRCHLKSGYFHVWSKVDVLSALTLNTPINGLTFDAMFQPYDQEEMGDGAYGLSTNYKGDNWGFKVSYADFKKPDEAVAEYNEMYDKGSADDADLLAYDLYYKLDNGMKFFVNAVDYSSNDESENYKFESDGNKYESTYHKRGIDGIDPVLGFQWKKIAGSKIDASIEYALNPRYEDTDEEYDEYFLGLKYHFSKQVRLEIEHDIVGDGESKTMYRMRYMF